MLVVVERSWRIDHPFKILNQEPPARGKLASPTLRDPPRLRNMREEQAGIDEVSRCAWEGKLGDVVRLESDLR